MLGAIIFAIALLAGLWAILLAMPAGRLSATEAWCFGINAAALIAAFVAGRLI